MQPLAASLTINSLPVTVAMQALEDQLTASSVEPQSWSSALPSAAPDDINSLGLFLPSECGGFARGDLSTCSGPLLQQSFARETAAEASRTSSVDGVDRMCQDLGHAPGTAGPFAFPTLLPKAGTAALQQPMKKAPSVNFGHQPSASGPSRSDGEMEGWAMLPPIFPDIVMIVDSDDTIVGTSSSLRACASTLCESSLGGKGIIDEHAGWQSLNRLGKFSDLLADEHAALCWQRACRSIQALRDSNRQIRARVDTESQLERHQQEMVLKRQSQGGSDTYIEVKVVAISDDRPSQVGHLMVQVRPLTLPSVAAISPRRIWRDASAQPHLPHLSTRPQYLSLQKELDTPELRLLVSRSGLILRTSCWNTTDFDACTQAILGHAVQPPLFGQSLVDVAQLAPLVHVVAQAAIVGLAQTVDLVRAGSKVQACVQPVLRSAKGDLEGVRSSELPAAKVWITLSTPGPVMRRYSSKLSSHRNLLSERKGLASERPGTGLDPHHSEQVSSADSSFYPLSWPHARIGHDARQAQPHMRTSDDQQRCAQESMPLEDSLSPLNDRIREETRILRAQLQARLRLRCLAVQQPRIQ